MLNPGRIVFPAPRQVAFEPFTPAEPGAGEVRVRTECTLMSTGTENIVFNGLYDPGTHWDRWVKFPFYPGYSSVGVIESVGPGVAGFSPGDSVATRTGHQSHAVVPAGRAFPLPRELPRAEAAWFSLAKIAFHGARAALYTLGDSVLVIGAGPIGQMSIRWAAAAGAGTIIAVDAFSNRLALAQSGGATAAIGKSADAARDEVLAANGGTLPRIVIDTTGNAAVFEAALALAADRGRVVILGDTGRPAQQHLTSDVIMRGLTITGAHDGHNTPEWNDATITRLFGTLASSGRFPLAGLNSHTFAPQDCAEAYATANRDRSATMGLIFDWTRDR